MRIATFNVEHLGLPHGEHAASLEARVNAMRPMIERLRADVLCLQEVDADRVPGSQGRRLAALDALLAGTPYADYQRHASGEAEGKPLSDVHNLVTLTRFPIVARREIRHKHVPPIAYSPVTATATVRQSDDEPISFDRPVLSTELRLPHGTTLHLFNLHLRAPIASAIAGQKASAGTWKTTAGWAEGFFVSAVKRAAQALDVRLAIDAILDADPGALICIAGDFNSEDHETPLKILAAASEDTGNGDLASGTLINLTRSLPADRRFSIVHHGRPQMVDHIVVSRCLLASFEQIEVHNEALGDEMVGYGRIRAFPGSFHAPVTAGFRLG